MKILPIFKSHYSLKSILTLSAPVGKIDPNYPVSIFDIAQVHNLEKVVVVDDNISGFLEASQNAKKYKINLVFGIRFNCIADITSKSEESLKTLHKIIVFIKNQQGYFDLLKIWTKAASDGFYYKPNLDLNVLKGMWTNNLVLGIPFYDSFLFNNTLKGGMCVPDFGFAEPTFFLEKNGLPFDNLAASVVKKYTEANNLKTIDAKTIYYYKNEDFLSYLTYRCIQERTTLEVPEMDGMCMDTFSFEEWEKLNQ